MISCISLPKSSDVAKEISNECQSHSDQGKSIFLCKSNPSSMSKMTQIQSIKDLGPGVRFNNAPKNDVKKQDSHWMITDWAGPYGGVPAFDQISTKEVKLALDEAILKKINEIETISNNPAPPSFKNTIEALENSGRALSNVMPYYVILSRNIISSAFRKIEGEIELKLAALNDQIMQNQKLFKRIEMVYLSPEIKTLSSEQQRVTWKHYNSFIRAGAKLKPEAKREVANINADLAILMTRFNQNLLAEEESFVELSSDELALLPQFLRAQAKANAEQRGITGKFIIVNTRSSVEPFLQSCPSRKLRKKIWDAFINRGNNSNETDNKAVLENIVRLRAKRSELLGYPTFAHWALEDSMAKEPERVKELFEAVWGPAVASVNADVSAMQKIVDSENNKFKIKPWDYRFYAEKLRKEKHDIEMNDITPYLQLDKLQNGMFWAAGQLFGFTFKQIKNVPVFHEKVSVWEVSRHGKHVGLIYIDPFARPGKLSGAWMTDLRKQEKFTSSKTPIVSINMNFNEGEPGQSTLLSFDDAETLFHEFGHALHGLASDVTYPSLSGIEVPQDYIEFPSRLMERWLMTPEIMKRFMLHHQSGEPIPTELIYKMKRASKFNQGFLTLEFLASAVVDLEIHMTPSRTAIDSSEFEKNKLAALNMPTEVTARHRLHHFAHLFSSEHYAALYYSYLWSDVLTSDAWSAFTAVGDPYHPNIADKLYHSVLSKGNSIDPAKQFFEFMDRGPNIDALMRERGIRDSKTHDDIAMSEDTDSKEVDDNSKKINYKQTKNRFGGVVRNYKDVNADQPHADILSLLPCASSSWLVNGSEYQLANMYVANLLFETIRQQQIHPSPLK